MPRSYSISFDEKRLARIRKKLGPDLVMPPLGRLMAEASRTAQHEAVKRAPSVIASAVREDPPTPLAARVVARHPGVRAMEAGRRPLVAGGNFPPPDAFLRMAGGDMNVAFAIARAVARRGTKGRFFMNKALSATKRRLPVLAEKAAREIAAAWESR